jgi:hypothetical protein
MPKKFYTEKDIDELVGNGIKSLQINDQIQLTEMAYEKAKMLGLRLITDGLDIPPSAPVRPYLSTASPAPRADSVIETATQPGPSPLAERIRAGVVARLGNQIDATLLDRIIQRVLASTGMK